MCTRMHMYGHVHTGEATLQYFTEAVSHNSTYLQVAVMFEETKQYGKKCREEENC